MGWVEEHPYKMGLIASVIVSLGASFLHYKQNYPFFDFDGFFLWLPVVWAMVLIFPVSNSIINRGKQNGVLQ